MKNLKNSLSILLMFFLATTCYGQIGATLGYGSSKAKIEAMGIKIDGESAGAFSLGLVYDLELADKLDLQPYLSFGIGEKIEEKSNNAIGLGADLQFYVAGKDKGFYVDAGLGWSKSLYDYEDGEDDDIKTSGFGLGLGLGYDITEAFNINVTYARSLTNYSEIDDVKLSSAGFGIQLQYLFN